MHAGRFVGRVGLLATALGIGTAALAGPGVAAADSSSPTGDTVRPTHSTRQTDRGPSRPVSPGKQGHRSGSTVATASAVTTRIRPGVPGSATTSGPSAAATAAASSWTRNPITINKTLAWDEGVLMGTLGATCTSCGAPLKYTVVGAPNHGGKININIGENATQTATGDFAYLPDAAVLTAADTTERFAVMVNSTTAFSRFLTGIPLLGSVFSPVLQFLYRTPLVGNLLAPIIGYATTVEFTPQASLLADGRPTAFTYKMPSFDGTRISLNYFPAVNVANGDVSSAPTIFDGPYLGNPGNTNPNSVYAEGGRLTGLSVPGVKVLRTDSSVPAGGTYTGGGGYNVVTWDPRGEFASEGVLQWDKPLIEGRDVSTMMTWITTSGNPARDQIAMADGNAVIGMVGGSYGGGIQLNTAGTDPRVKAIVPGITWNSLVDSFYPNGSYLTTYGLGLLGLLVGTGARVDSVVYASTLLGALTGYLTNSQQAFYASSGPTVLVNNIKAPALLIQGTVDILFPLRQAVTSTQAIAANGVPAKMIWFCGGHGECLDPENPLQGPNNMTDALKWLDQYVAETGTPAESIPVFQWYDQAGSYHSSTLLPSDPTFNNDTVTARGTGGILPIVSFLGGSGPAPGVPFPFNLNAGSRAGNAVNLTVALEDGQVVAGAPSVTATYTGLGNSRFVYAQLVDNATGRVLGNMTTPIPVTLDGRQHTITMPLADVAYTADTGANSLTLQLTSYAWQYARPTAFGLVKFSDVSVTLPIADPTKISPN